MNSRRVMTSQRRELAALRTRFGLVDLPGESGAVARLICRDISRHIGETVARATATHPQSCSRRELLDQAIHAALAEFAHLVDPQDSAPRWVSRMFSRLGRAEADAGWEIDVVLAALEEVHTGWWRAAAEWSTATGGTLPPTVSRAFTGYLMHLHQHAALGQAHAVSALVNPRSPVYRPRPEATLTELLERWSSTTPTFDVRVQSRRRGFAAAGRLSALDHVASMAPHRSPPAPPLLPGSSSSSSSEASGASGVAGASGAEGIMVSRTNVCPDGVLRAYRDCLMGLRLVESGLLPRHDLVLPSHRSESVPLHPSASAVSAVAHLLAPLVRLPSGQRTRAAHALRTRLHDHEPDLVVPEPRRHPVHGPDITAERTAQALALDTLIDGNPDLPGHRLATLAVLRMTIPVWQTME